MAAKFQNAKELKDWAKNAKAGDIVSDARLRALTVKKNAHGFSWRLRYKDDAGRYKVIKLANYPEVPLTRAREIAAAKLTQVAEGVDLLKEKKIKQVQGITGQAFLSEQYVIKLEGNKSGKQTEQMIRKHFQQLLKVPMMEISRLDISKWEVAKRKEGLAFDTLDRVYKAFKTMLNHAVKTGYLEQNPIKDISLTRYHTQKKADEHDGRVFFSDDEIRSILQALDDYQEEKRQQRDNSRLHGRDYLPDLRQVHFVDWVKPFMLLMLYTGIRNGDARLMRWESIDLNPFNANIRFTPSKTEHKDPSPITVPMPQPLVEVLKLWHEQCGKPQSGYLFTNPDTGKPYSKKAEQKPWQKIKKLAGIGDNVKLYSLRHTYISRLIVQGTDLLTVAKLAGHKTTQMIEKHYGHLRPDRTRQSIEDCFKGFAVAGETKNSRDHKPLKTGQN